MLLVGRDFVGVLDVEAVLLDEDGDVLFRDVDEELAIDHPADDPHAEHDGRRSQSQVIRELRRGKTARAPRPCGSPRFRPRIPIVRKGRSSWGMEFTPDRIEPACSRIPAKRKRSTRPVGRGSRRAKTRVSFGREPSTPNRSARAYCYPTNVVRAQADHSMSKRPSSI